MGERSGPTTYGNERNEEHEAKLTPQHSDLSMFKYEKTERNDYLENLNTEYEEPVR